MSRFFGQNAFCPPKPAAWRLTHGKRKIPNMPNRPQIAALLRGSLAARRDGQLEEARDS